MKPLFDELLESLEKIEQRSKELESENKKQKNVISQLIETSYSSSWAHIESIAGFTCGCKGCVIKRAKHLIEDD